MFACQSAVMLIIITRACGQANAGIFSISYSFASMMAFVGEYGVRKYQASDVNEDCVFSDYFTHRIITCIVMMAASAVYCIYGLKVLGYTGSKAGVLMAVCTVKLFEAVHDVYYGRFQQIHRLDIAAKTSSFRIILGMLVYAVSLIVTQDLLVSTWIWAAAVAAGFLLSAAVVAPEYCNTAIHFRADRLKKITSDCFPLFLGTFLLLYIGNAPKYAIDANLTDELQARFNYIFMPVFVIGLMANFIFNPILVDLADAWDGQKYDRFRKIILKQILVITGLTLLAIAVALTIGCPVLGMLYNTNLSDAKGELVVLMVGGGMLAMVNFITVVATIIRSQRHLIVGYVGVSLLALLFSGKAVMRYGLMGASAIYTLLLTVLTAVFAIVLKVCIDRGKRRKAA
ncbi:MAG: oligosaccharide flippase family protein [Mogibacterium sp.]|nr:oligosaccharide flippase family protein [Mogibacterium sp.]